MTRVQVHLNDVYVWWMVDFEFELSLTASCGKTGKDCVDHLALIPADELIYIQAYQA